MKIDIKTKIVEKFDFGLFSFCALTGFICVASLVFGQNESLASFTLAGLVCFPIGITLEKGFAGFLLNGALGQFAGVFVTLLPYLGSAGAMNFFILYLEILAITISLRVAILLAHKMIMTVSNKIMHSNANQAVK